MRSACLLVFTCHASISCAMQSLLQGQARESRQSSEDRKTATAAAATTNAAAVAGSAGASAGASTGKAASRDVGLARAGRTNSTDDRCKTAKGSVSSAQYTQQHTLDYAASAATRCTHATHHIITALCPCCSCAAALLH
jgi:hypothetical protein